MTFVRKAHKAVSFALGFKAAVGFAAAALALFGVTVPYFGYEVTTASGSVAALAGAAIGLALAAYA